MKKNKVLILFLWLSGIVAGMQFAKFASTIDLIQSEVGMNPLYSGWLLSSLGIIGIIFGITSGVIVSRFSPIKMVILSLWWASGASVLQAIFVEPEIMLLIRVLEGFSQLILVSAAPTALLQVTPKAYQSMIMIFWGTFFGMAFLIMNLLQGPLIHLAGWRGIFYGHAIFAAGVAVVLTLFLKRKGTTEDTNKNDLHIREQTDNKLSFIAQHKAVYKEVGSVLPGLLFGCHTLMYLVFLTYLPQRFMETYPQELGKNSFLLISMPLFSLAGTFLSGIVLNKIQKSPFILIQNAFGILIGLCILMSFSGSPISFLVLSSIMLLCSGVLQGSIFATIPYLSEDATIHAYANGAITQMGNIGTTIGAPLFSTLLIYFNWNGAFLLPIGSCLLGISFILFYRRK